MKIEKIEIKNFKTLEDVTIDFSGYFSSISGKNNAGKTSIIKAIKNLFQGQEPDYYFLRDEEISYSNSKTQWLKNDSSIKFDYHLIVTKNSDPGMHSFVKKIAGIDNLQNTFKIRIVVSVKEKNEKSTEIFIEGDLLKKYETGEIFKKISSSNIAFLHNSTVENSRMFAFSSNRSFHDMILSKDEKKELEEAQKTIKKKVTKFAQAHRGELSGLLGKLDEKYEVELTVFDSLFRNSIPLGINLRDKGVEVPLDQWGAGTQNRTHIIMSILSASRVKQQENDENRITPIIIIEEPESFLHPSAQSEFGRVIRELARELEIQIIITTHSPYMLCQEELKSNILLDRRTHRGKLKEAVVVDVSAERWMEPFSKILGLNDEAIKPWRGVVEASANNIIFVEGISDKEYLEYISSLEIKGLSLPKNVEIVPYGGKDALKNSVMLQFMINKFNRVFITYDLDAKNDLEKTFNNLNLKESVDYMSVGLQEDGKDNIEGLLPEHIHSAVHSENTNLIMKLTSANASIRKSAKNELKSKKLLSFKSSPNHREEDLKEFKTLFAGIQKAFKNI